MASYHFAVQVRGRAPKADLGGGAPKKGANAVAAAAYRARTQLKDERSGRMTKDYAEKGGFQRAEILAPEGAASWLKDREQLWNAVEAAEIRKDAQLFREVNMALPHELTDAERFEMVREFVGQHFVSKGMVADIAWHAPVPENGDDRRNFHAHVMLTLRKGTPGGLYRVKTREWNSKELVEEWRAAWCAHQNRWLERRGHKARVDHRSLKAQRDDAVKRGDRRAAERLDRTPEIHVGPMSRQIARNKRTPASRDREQGLRMQPRKERYERPKRLTEEERKARRYTPALDPWERQAPGFNDKPERIFWKSKQRKRPAPEGPGRALTREEAARAVRVVRYREIDRGSRVDWLAAILGKNSARAKARQGGVELRIARLQRKLTYWERQIHAWQRQADFVTDRTLMSRAWRFAQAQKAREEREAREAAARKRAHAEKRAAQVKDLMQEFELVFAAARGGRAAVLARQQEMERWTQQKVRESERAQTAGRGDQGRTRER